jgi:hypothetical protein
MPMTIIGNTAESLIAEGQHLILPYRTTGRRAVEEDDQHASTPVVVIEAGRIAGRKVWHCPYFLLFVSYWKGGLN